MAMMPDFGKILYESATKDERVPLWNSLPIENQEYWRKLADPVVTAVCDSLKEDYIDKSVARFRKELDKGE